MTITSSVTPPTAPVPSAAPATSLAAPVDAAASAGFAALVARLLGDSSTGSPASGVLTAMTTDAASADEVAGEASEEPVDEAVACAPPEVAVPMTAGPVPVVPTLPAVVPTAPDAGGDGSVSGGQRVVDAAAGAGTEVVARAAAGAPASDSATGATATAPAGEAPAQPVAQQAAQPTAPHAAEPTSQAVGPSAGQPPTGAVAASGGTPPVLPAGIATPPATTAPPAPPAHVPAVAQVVPEVTRLVSRGDGVHRLTMRLQPEALGEVRVTLTVRDGAVQVHLTGGEDAARALAEGAPELRRVLELAGAGEARVVVRDLVGQQSSSHGPPTAGGSAQQTSYGADGDTSSPGSPGGGTGQQGHHARTRGGAGATDGLTDGASPLRPDPVTGARQGIDLTM